MMIQIQNTLVSLDLVDTFFCCDLDKCLGVCCIEGDAGAPITKEEEEKIREVIPLVSDELSPKAREVIREQGPSYIDEEGDLVTSIVDGRDCVFTCYAPGGKCLCALEKAHREGKTAFVKPVSCHLYPVRLKEYSGFTAVNMHQWKICKPAFAKGRRLGIRAYEFLKEPLIARFGQEWYDELHETAQEYLKQNQ